MSISIITPSYRSGKWLPLCIASVADQGVPVEHLIQDAGSDDGTLDWLPQDPRVRVYIEKDQGMYDAVNRGLKKATGDLLAYLNCDEQYLPGALTAVQDFFDTHPDIDVLFGDTVVVNGEGRYLWHRKVLVPLRLHTELFPLSTLTCATFFRRRVLDEHGIYFNPEWRVCGDSVWARELLRHRLGMGILRQFTSVFTHTGNNLSIQAGGPEEARRFFAQAPRSARLLKPLVRLHHWLRRWRHGIYSQKPFVFSCYTPQSPKKRVEQWVDKPTFRWRW